MFPYICAMRYYDELEATHPVVEGYALVMGENIADVMRHIVDYYGEDNIAEVTLIPIGDGCDNVLELSKEMYDKFKNETV